ncbi:MAG: hypothetical protein IJW48_00245 [Clostridia bacterium]|nr:hypothetical protein [Clostridia bacterium]
MKKIIALVLTLVLALSLASCGNTFDPAEKSEGVMTYAEYAAAELDTEVVIEAYVQATQSWWDNKITVYAADPDGAYFIYEMACSEADSKKLTEGTKIKVTGTKGAWEGEVEIMDATFEFVGAADHTYVATAFDATSIAGDEDALLAHQNELVTFKGATVEAISFKNDGGDDIYLTAKVGNTTIDFCVEKYLTGPETEVYKAVEALEVGDVIDIECFLYWYKGANPHVVGVTAK